MKRVVKGVLLLGLSIGFGGCIKKEKYKGCHEPIYLSWEKLRSDYPRIEAPREIEKAGKIYVYQDTILISEKNRGIHIIDNSVPETPRKRAFIALQGNIDIAVKDGYLYADSFTDLVVLDMMT